MMNSNSNKQLDGLGDAPSGASSGLAIDFLSYVDATAEFIDATDVGALPAEDLGVAILEILQGLKTRIESTEEKSFVSRKASMFYLEQLSLRLRRNRDEHDVSREHAAILDAAIAKIQATRSGALGDPDVERLKQLESKQKEWLKAIVAEAGILVKVPTDQPEIKKLIVS